MAVDKWIEAVKRGEVSGFSIAPDSPLWRFTSIGIDASPGTKIVFMGENGTDADITWALRHLKVGETYTVDRLDVGGWSSDVFLREVPGKGFNTVHFAEVSGEPESDDGT